MDQLRRRRAIRALADFDLVEMKPTGKYGLTTMGREFLDQLEVLRELDDRPGARAVDTEAGAVKPADSTRRGDDVPAARRARRKNTRDGRRS